MDVSGKLQIKPGQRVITLAGDGDVPAIDAPGTEPAAKAGQLGTDLNRDILAAALAGQGVQPVRQVAIDETWSALRFVYRLGDRPARNGSRR